jgi:pyridoxamine 5'-phosphate oxidase
VDASSLRKEYTSAGLDKADVDPDPIVQFHRWFEKVIEADLHEPNAMILATATTTEGKPSARTVLLKGYDERGFVFYTNYEGRKAKEIEANPRCALLFYWGELERQVRIEGRASRLSGEESDAYFASRPRGSRLGAWASEQSSPVEDRSILEERVKALDAEYEGREIPRPPFWGGYRVEPDTIEFWQGRESRLHDRLVYLRNGGEWKIVRLQP